MKLSAIQDTVQAVADAISEAVGVETEIVGDDQIIVAGTGRYKDRVGTIEECGDSSTNEIYGMVLRTGTQYIVEDAINHPDYWGTEGELAEICCPINLDGKVIGIIGLVAFNEVQKNYLLEKKESLLNFCSKLSYLISTKAREMAITSGMRTILSAINDGIFYVNTEGMILECNNRAAELVSREYNDIIGRSISDVWAEDVTIIDAIRNGEIIKGMEKQYTNRDGWTLHFLIDILPIRLEEAESCDDLAGSVIYFKDMVDIKQMVYDMTEKRMPDKYDTIIGKSEAIVNVKETINRIADSRSSVLITGDSGVGKSLIAKIIHNSSKRSEKPFIVVNCAAIPDTLIESELFGYDEGAFTGAKKNGKPGKFELADGGTIFLDEIGDLPFHLQGKLLHVLQHGRFERVGGTKETSIDVRVIAATNRDFEQMIKNKEFREDLYFRLNVIPIWIPSLKDRREDVPLLLNTALDKYRTMLGKQISGYSEDARKLLVSYNWPGNVRELENAVEYAVNMEDTSMISAESLPEKVRNGGILFDSTESLEKQRNAFEKNIIENCLREEGYTVNDKRRVARMLGIGEATLYRKIKALGISAK